MPITMNLRVDARSPIPIRRQLTEQLKHAIESGAVPRDQTLPSIRELASLLGINTNTVARVIEDLKHGGYVEARRGRGVFVATAPPIRPAPGLREGFLKDMVIRGAALGMTADDLAVGVLSLADVRPAAIDGASEVLLVECSAAELDFFARQLEGHLPIRVDKVLLGELKTITRRRMPRRWQAAVTSFCHLPEVERVLSTTDDRALDPRAIEMLAALLVSQNGGTTAVTAPAGRKRSSAAPSEGRTPRRMRSHG